MANNIKGLDRLQAKLRQAEQSIPKTVDRVIKESAYQIEAQAKMLAPVDTAYMRNSITTKIAQMQATISVGAEYGQFVEFGTSKQPALSLIHI